MIRDSVKDNSKDYVDACISKSQQAEIEFHNANQVIKTLYLREPGSIQISEYVLLCRWLPNHEKNHHAISGQRPDSYDSKTFES